MEALIRGWKSLKNKAGAFLFWGWVLFVSFWLETAGVREPASGTPQKFSDLNFTQMHFEQLYQDGTHLVMQAPSAHFNSDRLRLEIQKPFIQWENAATKQIFNATGALGEISVDVEASALPSEFKQLLLSGGSRAWNNSTSVDSERMLFDNDQKLFYFPGSIRFRQKTQKNVNNYTMKDRAYDPIGNKLVPLTAEMSQILHKGIQNQP